jgi:tetratricopeptide (TPR) repeat protein
MAGLTVVLSLTGCAPQQKQPTAPQDKPLVSFQTNLLQTAFDFATMIPAEPHIKSRSLTQRQVVSALIELECPAQASNWIQHIETWHQGAAYADLAVFFAERNWADLALDSLRHAEQGALSLDTWHKDRIFSRMAQALEQLGDTQAVARVTSGIDEQETARVHQTRSGRIADEQYQTEIDALKKLLADQKFDLQSQGMQGIAVLYNRFYNSVERRTEMEAALRKTLDEFPPVIKIDLFLKMAQAAVQHGDFTQALSLVRESEELFNATVWRPRFGVPVLADISKAASDAGDPVLSRKLADQAMKTYQDGSAEVINIFKADVLLPVAEAYQIMGDTSTALAVYAQAVESAVENPNSRPRAEDLSAICISMAVNNVEPDEALWKRIKEIQANLGEPW